MEQEVSSVEFNWNRSCVVIYKACENGKRAFYLQVLRTFKVMECVKEMGF